jgi:hypothetical protein
MASDVPNSGSLSRIVVTRVRVAELISDLLTQSLTPAAEVPGSLLNWNCPISSSLIAFATPAAADPR